MPLATCSFPDLCPCGRMDAQGKPAVFRACCGQFITGSGQLAAPDAEALMRSRYSAFVLQDAAYLLATWHVSTRPASIEFDPNAKWLGLQVKQHLPIDATRAEVEFVARQRDASGRAVRLHERSRFLRAQGRWFYVDRDLPGPVATAP